MKTAYTKKARAMVLKKLKNLTILKIPIPPILGPSVRVEIKACGICGSDLRYYSGENLWSLHILGEDIPSPLSHK